MTPKEWAVSVKPDLIALQRDKGIPALWSAAQHCHEAFNPDGTMSALAKAHFNFAGVKWAEWQRAFGCKPISMSTWEELDGERVDLEDAFCSCPSWDVWLQVYGSLLTGTRYSPALQYRQDPLLYGYHIWKSGWATDSRYVSGVASWVTALWDDYADTLQAQEPEVTVYLDGTLLPDTYRLANGSITGKLRWFLDRLRKRGYTFAYDPHRKRLDVDKGDS